MRLQLNIWLFMSSCVGIFSVNAAFRAPSRFGSLSPYLDVMITSSSPRHTSQINLYRSIRGGVAVDTAGRTELKEVQGNFRQLLRSYTTRHGISTQTQDQKEMSKIKTDLERYEGYKFVERMQELGGLQTSQRGADVATFKLAVQALFLIAVSDQSKQTDILQFFLEASGPVFDTFPDLSQVEHLKKFETQIVAREACRALANSSAKLLNYYEMHLRKEIDRVWKEQISTNPLKVLIDPISESSRGEFMENLRSGLTETASQDWVSNDSYILRLRILFACGLISISHPDHQLNQALHILEGLTRIHGLSTENRIATIRAYNALSQLSQNF
ncbi:hypothetical protein Pst134EA_024070 [Puccinia striiformis f. sp. tritici]|uniref:hypothetical protein n=1 Tax=Puccinia striiformis f. sp. tritici TaxID=168172 RepID=UPI002008B4A6|nr:hypothetical protein Pst134EA_024070 [Puccinia striiformis f. sp. tritici]KAH9453183.1 hypothetical protein Pst134EA_024070 [Puccinia striiformis f. sp. tritici]